MLHLYNNIIIIIYNRIIPYITTPNYMHALALHAPCVVYYIL